MLYLYSIGWEDNFVGVLCIVIRYSIEIWFMSTVVRLGYKGIQGYIYLSQTSVDNKIVII